MNFENQTISELWKENSQRLENFICSKVNHEDHCHDILHDLFLKISEKEEKLRLVEQPASYVIKMAQNAVIDYYRAKKKAAQQLEENDDYISNDEQLSVVQLADCCLLSFIKNLPAAYSEALILADLEGLSQKELAEKLNISYTAAKSRVQRARKMLKDAILNCCPYQFDKYGNIIGCCK
jgi:RNA polymerase sigma-70 factor, ECF subfamily